MWLFNVILVYLFAVIVCEELNLPEGSPCNVKKIVSNYPGTCVSLYKCQSAAMIKTTLDAGFKGYYMPPICSYKPDGEPIVCCTDCDVDNDETMRNYAAFVYGAYYKRAGSISWTKCLEYFRTLPYPCRGENRKKYWQDWNDVDQCDNIQITSLTPVYIGVPAKKNQFPHMALLGYGKDRDSAQWLCGGTVISEWFILTAAHCSSAPKIGSVTYAGLGILKREELSKYWRVYKIASIIKHPLYAAPAKYHDIALLKTETEINFSKALMPACLNERGKFDNLPLGKWASAPGWGRLGPKADLADHLQVIQINKFEDEECSTLYPPHRNLKNGYDNQTQMCFGERETSGDTCEGDSGGPLHLDIGECMYFVIGVTSYGISCGMEGNAGMYTKVSYYVPWIESIVWPDE
ncbi:granzyme-like protein 1 [Anticarsia gemmatalis]|uniref:granzyme-like protein 1 n=1 Tax=Anticarsia gemmatalis TaxID=129554 RepID=UPI003F775E06